MNKPLIEVSGGVEKHQNGSFTIYGSICGETYKRTYFYDYSISEARKHFKKAINRESEKYFIGQ